jgi:uncharacterized iron-regulated protein
MPTRADAAICRFGLPWLCAACAGAPFDWRPPGDLDAYHARFERAVGDRWLATADLSELIATLRDRRLLWLGDHHRSPALHALQRELLVNLIAAGERPRLLLEAIGEQDAKALARFAVDGDLAALRSAVRARWPGSWLDAADVDADHYRQLLALAFQHGLSVEGLEPTPRVELAARDARIADNVGRAVAAANGRLVVVLVGQTHLLGGGDLCARVAAPALAIGGEPPPKLRAARGGPTAGQVGRSDGGLWWFGALLARDR